MSSHGSNLKNLFKLREPIKDLTEVSILKTKHLDLILGAWLNRHVFVLISDLEYETNVTKVASLFKTEQHLFIFFPVGLDTAPVDEVYARANRVLPHDTRALFQELKGNWGGDMSNQLVIRSESKLLVMEKDCELCLERL